MFYLSLSLQGLLESQTFEALERIVPLTFGAHF